MIRVGDKRKAFPDAHQQVEQPEFAGGAPRGVGAPTGFGVWNYNSQRWQWSRDPADSPRSVLQTDHHSLTPSRRILATATSPYYTKRNHYYSKLKEKQGEELEKKMADVLWDETNSLRKGGKRWEINLELFGHMLMAVINFVFNRRREKTRAKALVAVLFGVLLVLNHLRKQH